MGQLQSSRAQEVDRVYRFLADAYQRGTYPWVTDRDVVSQRLEFYQKRAARVPEWDEQWPTLTIDLIELTRLEHLKFVAASRIDIMYMCDIASQRDQCQRVIEQGRQREREWPLRQKRLVALNHGFEDRYFSKTPEEFEAEIRPKEIRKTCLSLLQGLVQGGYLPVLDMTDSLHYGYTDLPDAQLHAYIQQAKQRQEQVVGGLRREEMEEGAQQISHETYQ